MFVKKPTLLKLYTLLAAIGSVFSFYRLNSIPSGVESAIFFGYSTNRLLLLACLVIPFFLFGLIFAAISVSSVYLNKFILFVDNIFAERWKHRFIIVFSSLLVFLSALFTLLPSDGLGGFIAVRERFAPLVYFGGFLGAQTLLGQFFWRDQKIYFQNLHKWESLLVITKSLFAFVMILSVWVSWSGIGLKPETYGWHTPGTPILSSQLFLAFFLSLLFLIFNSRVETWYINLRAAKRYAPKFHTVIFLILWLTAFLVWQGEPMRKQSYFTPTPTAPNYEYYPYSDAAFYDTTAQSILIGEGRNLDVVLRPLYVFFLTILHLIVGQNYAALLTLQTLCLAIMPGLVFLLISLLGNQSAGILSAILIIFRERNSIALTNIIEVSHSKLILSDLPTMMFMVLFVYCLVNWLRKSKSNYWLGIISGAAFGLVLLVRSQAQLLLPVLLVGIVFSDEFQWQKAIQRIMVFTLGLLIVITPWVWRNYQVSGKPALENAGFYIRMIAGGYAEPTDVMDVLPGESLDAYNARMNSQIVHYIINHPAGISRIYLSYFIHNEISSVVYLPMSLKVYSLRSYVTNLSFWDDPYINLANSSGVMFFVTLGLIALGVGTAFQRLKLLGLFPLLIHFTYSFSVVLVRISGWRFILPVDWILQAYYCIGLIQLALIIVSIVWNKVYTEDTSSDQQQNPVVSSFFQKKTYFALVGFLILGLSLPMIEFAMPMRYPRLSEAQLIQTYAANGFPLESGVHITASELKTFLETEAGATVLYGRALYPSYYGLGKYWGDSNPDLMAASQFNRLQFSLIGPSQTFVFIPLLDVPKYFPHAADVLVIGCKQDDFVKALIIKVNDIVLVSSPWRELTCSAKE